MKTSFIVKMGIGFIILLFALVLMYFTNWLSQRIYLDFEKEYNAVQRTGSKFNQLFQTQSIYFLYYGRDEHNKLLRYILELTERLEELKKEYPKASTLADNYQDFIDEYQEYLNEINTFGLVRIKLQDSILTPEEVILRKDILSRIDIYLNGSEEINKNLTNIYKVLERKKARLDRIRFFLTNFITLSGIIIGMAISILLLFRVRRSLIMLTNFVGRIAAGDFTAKAKIKSRDEIQQLAENIKDIISFENTLLKIKESTKTLEKSYKKINEAVANINQVTLNQEKSVEQASISFNKLANALNEISEDSQETKNLTSITQEKTQVSSKQIRDTISEINLLSDFASKIMGTVKIINSMTEQTELLSLNAAIEAAKAGSAGKGFAVVASEIGKLAETSNEATKEISVLAEEIIDKIKRTTSKSEISVNALMIIENSIEEVAKEIEEISGITREKSLRSKTILDQVKQVDVLTKKNTENANKIIQSNMNLKKQVDELHNLVNKFRLSKS